MTGYELHHLGVAVPDVEKAMPVYESLFGYRLVDGPYDDPIQKVRVVFIRREGAGGVAEPLVELIAPLTPDAPVNRYLAKDAGAYHLCYTVPDMEGAMSRLRGQGCLLVSAPAPAVAFGGRRIAWLFTPTRQLVEIVERGSTPSHPSC